MTDRDERRRFARKALEILCVNLAMFAAYRLAFLATFADAASLARAPRVLAHGLRLDVALLGRELLVVTAIALLMRHLVYRRLLHALWAITYVNAAVGLVNFFFFRERNQHLWEMLLANIGAPAEIVVAVEPFIAAHPWLPFAIALVTAAFAIAAARHARALADAAVPRWRGPRALATTAALALVFSLPGIELIPDKTTTLLWTTLASKHYMSFPDYVLNQAVVNPVYDVFRYFRASSTGRPRYRLAPDEALRTATELLDVVPADARYPLLRTIRGDAGLGIRNLVLIQVEGLGGSVLEHRVGDAWLMPFLHELAERGLCFPNLAQSFNATDGSLFATATSLHRTYAVQGDSAFFLPYEVNGLYGALPQLLGPEYHHYFFAGFRQRIADFVTFMSNQGFESAGYYELLRRLGPRAEVSSSRLGIDDHPMLQEAAVTLARSPQPFTAHIMTATSHSPWVIPPTAAPAFPDKRLAAFRYADDSLRAFVASLRATLPDFEHTLFALIGDHTSLTFGDDLAERVRVALIVWSPALEPVRARWMRREGTPGSHVDVVPTMLGLLDGEHPYSGMGRSLLADPTPRGIISSTHHDSLYIRDGFALRYTPLDASAELYPFESGTIVPRDVSADHPDTARRLTGEYLALYEVADRLTREKRILPRDGAPERRLTASPATP